MTTLEVGQKLVECCSQGRFMDAINQLYSPDIVSVEAVEGGGMPRTMQGIDAIRGKNEWWTANHDIHSCKLSGPFPHDDRFGVIFDMDVTAKSGPMSGKRMQMQELALYSVKGGKIVKEEFFYTM